MANWKNLDNGNELENIISKSQNKPVAIFKHSTRCSISAMVLNRLKRDWNDEEMQGMEFYFLDLLTHRDISNQIAEQLDVTHQSPQIILIKDGKAVYHKSHTDVSYSALKGNL